MQGAPIAGYLLEAYGGENGPLKAYRPAIFFAGSMALTASLLVGLIKVKGNRKFVSKI